MAIGAGYIAKFVASLIDGGGLDNILAKKFEDLGEDFLRSQISGQFGGAGKLLSGLDGQAQFDRLRSTWLNKAKGQGIPGQGVINKLFGVLDSATQAKGGGGRGSSHAKWARSSWARSRNEWLDNHWKHDWRSQPRNPQTGQWMPGRLDHIENALRYRGIKPGRATKRRRKLRRQARMRGRKAARKLFRR